MANEEESPSNGTAGELAGAMPDTVPAPEPDDLAWAEERQLTAKQQSVWYQRQLVIGLKRRVACLEACENVLRDEIHDLNDIRVENAKYRVVDRFSTLFFIVCTPTILMGALFVETADRSTPLWGLGWGLLIVGLAVQFLLGLFNPRI